MNTWSSSTGAAIDSDYDDPLYGCQSHLHRINAADAWAVAKGEGVNVAVLDGAESFDHQDLRDNVNASRNHSYVQSVVESDPRSDLAQHGITVAGIIAARDNSKGVCGVAPRATIFGHNLVLDDTLSNALDALTRNKDITGVSNNSWSYRNSRGAHTMSQLWTAALESGVSEGNGGKGVFYVFSAGNRHLLGQHVGLHEGKNFYAQTTVCAVDRGRKEGLLLGDRIRALDMRSGGESHDRQLGLVYGLVRRHVFRRSNRVRRRRPGSQRQHRPHMAGREAHTCRIGQQERPVECRLGDGGVDVRLRQWSLPLQSRVRFWPR